jgi:enoyl-CoA hydratase/carnithine racemase
MRLELSSQRSADGMVTLWLSHPKRSVVVLDAWLLDQLHLFFDELDKQPTPAGFVLMSASDRVFVAGADLAEIDALDDAALHAYLTEGAEAFARISALPCPSVACVNRTALGGGLEIALHCDSLIAAKPAPGEKPWKLGLPEASLGLCPGWGGTQMLPARIDPGLAIRMTATGQTWTIDQAPDGLFDAYVDNVADLHEAAVRWIRNHPSAGRKRRPRSIDDCDPELVERALDQTRPLLPETPSAHAVVEAMEVGLREGWRGAVAAERRLLVSLRHTPAAREHLDKFFAKQ